MTIVVGVDGSEHALRALRWAIDEARLREVVLNGGFSQFRRATQTPFNRVFEARP